jgi:acetyl esterase/lipase
VRAEQLHHTDRSGVNYRKCLSPTSAFPAPILDALAGYIYLTDILHFAAKDIILVGESAGGHLALALARYLSELRLPQPGLIALNSPWADFTMSFPSHQSNAAADWLTIVAERRRLVPMALSWTGQKRIADPYFSPALAKAKDWDFLRDSRVYIMTGTKEVFYGENTSLAQGMKEAGVHVFIREVREFPWTTLS